MRVVAKPSKVLAKVRWETWPRASYFILAFTAYCFFGWIVETGFIAITQHRLAYRGLIRYGLPLVPLYGFCTIIIVGLLAPYKKHPLRVYGLAVLLGTVAEYVTSLLDKYAFHQTTWNYANIPFSYNDRIALPISLCWGLIAMVMIYWYQPTVNRLIKLVRPWPAAIIAWPLLLYGLTCGIINVT